LTIEGRTTEETRFTSTGNKYWAHRGKLEAYRDKVGRSVISTHIAPEGACNLKCPYCSVTHRKVWNRIEYDVIIDYLEKLLSRGLKAVIFTGGGEPTTYPKFNELLEWVFSKGLEVGLITNGTKWHKIDLGLVGRLSWVRVSINIFPGWEDLITAPTRSFAPECVFGMSYVWTRNHEHGGSENSTGLNMLCRVHALGTGLRAKYIRIQPDCQLYQEDLSRAHADLANELQPFGEGNLFFHHNKNHRLPTASRCHQSYFRPFLSEEVHPGTGKPGSVFPCDSVILNRQLYRFDESYALCAPGDILDYMDHKIQAPFSPNKDCAACVFTDNIDALDDYVERGVERFDLVEGKEVHHPNFP